MAASRLDGEKVCEVSGSVRWSSLTQAPMSPQSGSLVVSKLSDSFYIHARTTAKRVKFPLKANKFSVNSRDSRLTLSVNTDSKTSVSIHLKEANPSQLRLFLDSLNDVKAYCSSSKGKLSSSSSRESNIQNIENQPCNTMNSSNSAPEVFSCQSPLRSKLVPLSPRSPQKLTPNRPSNYFAKQMNLPSSYTSQNKKTPFFDQTRARDNLSNTSSSSKSASSFYGRNSGLSSVERKRTGTLGPGLMPPPRLSSQITFRSREKRPFEKEVTLTGFSNLGNTCYMNAILQSLLGVPPFVQDLSNKALLDRVHPHCLYRCLYSVMMWKRKCTNAELLKSRLKKLKQTISEAATRFSGYHQHDAHEFLCQVFDQLRDDVDTCNSPSSKPASKEGSGMLADTQCPVTRSFESAVLHTVNCKQCGESALKEEIYYAFSLDIPTLLPDSSSLATINLQTLIEKHFKDEELEYKCSKCEAKEAVISHSFIRLPRVLVLHLKRYEYDNLTEEQAKKQDKVNIERFIDLSMLCSPNTKPPLAFCPKPSTLRMSPPKSKQKPLKRHFIHEGDDGDDSNDFQPSPSVRRKLDHLFQNTSATSPYKMSSPTAAAGFKSGKDTFGSCELNIMKRCKENSIDGHFSARKGTVWKGTEEEEEEMEWAIAESVKSAEKAAVSTTQQVGDNDVQRTEKVASTASLFANESVLNTNVDCNNAEGTETWNSGKDFAKNEVNVRLPEDPVWARSEDEQLKWALAESTKSAEKELKARPSNDETKRTNKCNLPKPVPGDFVFISDVSDEDLVNAATERNAEEPLGLKGGGPVTTETCLDELVVSDRNCSGMESDDVGKENDENCNDNSGLEVNTKKPILKNTPIKNFNKYRKRTVHHKQKACIDSEVLNTTPALGKFDGYLFDEVLEEPKSTPNNISPRGSNRRSCYHNPVTKFRDEDIEKAINMSLQDQQAVSEEDEELKRVLQLSLQEFEEQCPPEDHPASPRSVNVAETENLSYSAIQEEESELSTHSYRLISIVRHLGTRSTSGHYISDVYDCKAKQWTSYDDSTATKVTEHSVRYKRQQSGYIFFYLYKQCVDAIENSASVKDKK